MKLNTIPLLFVLTAGPFAAAHAGADLSDMIAPGLWEMTVQMQIEGISTSMPAQTVQQCVTQAELAKNRGIPKPQTHGDVTCKTTSMNRSGNTLRWTMACTGQSAMQMDGIMTFDSHKAYHSTVHMTGTMQGRQIRMTQSLQGKRIGECQS